MTFPILEITLRLPHIFRLLMLFHSQGDPEWTGLSPPAGYFSCFQHSCAIRWCPKVAEEVPGDQRGAVPEAAGRPATEAPPLCGWQVQRRPGLWWHWEPEDGMHRPSADQMTAQSVEMITTVTEQTGSFTSPGHQVHQQCTTPLPLYFPLCSYQ